MAAIEAGGPQLSLEGMETSTAAFETDASPLQQGRAPRYTLFFALFPRPEDAHQIADAARALRQQHRLTGSPTAPARLHVTLHALAGFVGSVPLVCV